MGTDIHMGCEVRNKKTGKWETMKRNVFKGWNDEMTSVPYDNRNYNLFAILADVRNGYGFAGCITGDKFEPIAYPKGLPDDMDPDTAGYLSDEHTPSWLTLQELLEYDWSRKHKSCGYVGVKDYLDVILGKAPNSWCGGIGGPKIAIISEDEMKKRTLGEIQPAPGDETMYYTHCWFDVGTYKDCAGDFYTETMEVLKTLIPDGGDASDVRIVFDFDS